MRVIGERFGDFQLLREVGKGAVARVYLASDGRRVRAVKLFPERHRARAEQEYAFGHDLDHPHLNPVEAKVEVAGHPGVAMPFVPGVQLGSWLETRPRDAFLATFAGVLKALAYLHGRGIVHRDVKPENILVDRSGHARLIDFDLATRTGAAPGRRTLAGTFAYLSPEQARGEPARPASDLYAAGVILYRGLTGEVPFSGSPAEVIAAHRERTPPVVSSFDAALRGFDALVAQLLDKDPGRRPPDAAAVATALERTLEPG